MAESEKTNKVMTANQLSDGAIVYLNVTNGVAQWESDIAKALVFNDADIVKMEALAQGDVSKNIVIDPYAIEITGNNKPLSARETIRASGPSVKYGHAALKTDSNH